MAETGRQVNTPPEILIPLGVAAMLYGAAIFRWWRAAARWTRRMSFGPKRGIEWFYGTDEDPKRGTIFVIAGGFVVWGIAVVVVGMTKL